jgi:hypothetical protein
MLCRGDSGLWCHVELSGFLSLRVPIHFLRKV